MAAALFHQVAHVEQDHGGQADGQHGGGKHQLPGHVQRVKHEENGVRLGRSWHASAQDVDGDARVFRVGRERVDSRQIDQGEVFAADTGHEAKPLLDCDAGEVGHFLAESGQLVEKCRFAGIGRTDQYDRL